MVPSMSTDLKSLARGLENQLYQPDYSDLAVRRLETYAREDAQMCWDGLKKLLEEEDALRELHIYQPDELGFKMSRYNYKSKCGRNDLQMGDLVFEKGTFDRRSSTVKGITDATCEACILVRLAELASDDL